MFFSLLLEREEEAGREGETSIWDSNMLPPACTLTGDQNGNLGMCPDWELSPQTFGAQSAIPTNWATGQGATSLLFFFPFAWNIFLSYFNLSQCVCFYPAVNPL